jgi:hypothetical protein
MIALLFWLQAANEAEQAARIDAAIPWLSDGTELVDMELLAGHHPQFPDARPPKNYACDRPALLEKAKAEAAKRGVRVLWYCPRMHGNHMYRAYLLDRAMRAACFGDPDVAALIRERYVPLRMCADEAASKAVGVKAFEFIEPGFIVMGADGKLLHVIDRIRTYNSDWFFNVLVAASGKPAPEAPEAVRLRRAGRFEELLKLDLPAGLVGLGRFDEAREALADAKTPEALYRRAVAEAWSGRNPATTLRSAMESDPNSPWAWRAAANLVKADDTLPEGPLSHHLEDVMHPGVDGVPKSTGKAGAGAREGLRFLLRAQHADGAWRDARYAYWPNPHILPNVWTAITALAARALWEHRDLDPKAVDTALLKADAFLKDEARTSPGHNEESYALAYRLHYFVRRGDREAAAKVVARLATIQDAQGHWPHEYPNPFSTAVVVHALAEARKAGLEVPSGLFQRAAGALKKTRAPDGRQAYNAVSEPDNPKSSSSRTALCDLALWEAGEGPREAIAAGLKGYWAFVDRMDAVRLCDYHSDGRLAGFFYFHAAWHASEAARACDDGQTLTRLRERIPTLSELDGSWIDSHELGKSYATASALLLLR